MQMTYTLYGQDGTYRQTLDCTGLQRLVERHAKEGDAIGYFMETLGPRIAPYSFNTLHDAVAEYLTRRREEHWQTYTNLRDPRVEVNAVMDTIDFLLQEEERIFPQN